MKLGIIVVYLISKEDEKLLDIHLDHIAKNTTSDYTIYANVNMLLPKFKQILKNDSNVKICPSNDYIGPIFGLRATYELAYYAEKLIKKAIGDDVTHVIIMHPDSFPIKVGWERILEKQISNSTVMVSKFPEMSACLFFSRSFYLNYNPKLISTKIEMKSSKYKSFLKDIGEVNLLEPGMGYAFEIFKRILQWKSLVRSNLGEDHYFYGSIFDDIFFHLGATSHDDRSFYKYEEKPNIPRTKKLIAKLLPTVIKEMVKTSFLQLYLEPEIKTHKYYHSFVKKNLFSDPDGYIKFLRTGIKN